MKDRQDVRTAGTTGQNRAALRPQALRTEQRPLSAQQRGSAQVKPM